MRDNTTETNTDKTLKSEMFAVKKFFKNIFFEGKRIESNKFLTWA